MRLLPAVPIALGLLSLAGCRETSAPVPLEGVYDLVAVNGGAQPGAVPATTPGCTISLAQGSARLVPADSTHLMLDFQFWRGLKCPGFLGSGYVYDQQSLRGTLDAASPGLTLAFPFQVAGTMLPVALAAGLVSFTLPDTIFGIAGPTALVFARRASLPTAVSP